MTNNSDMQLIPTLSDAEVQAIEAEVAHLPDRQSAAIDALRIVQVHRGWVSDASVSAIAQLLDMSPAAVDSIATFYNLIYRQPVGRHVILVCDSVSCFLLGSETISQTLTKILGIELGQTTEDDRFTLLPIVCLGACDHAPTLMIDEDLIHDVTPENLEGILQTYE